MLNIKIIGSVALVLGAVACEPLPVHPPNHNRPYPRHNNRDFRDQEQRRNDRDFRNNRDYRDSRDYDDSYNKPDPRRDQDVRPNRDRDPLGEYDDAPRPTRDSYPTAERTDNPNRVLSPYSPYNVIDVEGFRSGQLAKDPSNGKIFRVP